MDWLGTSRLEEQHHGEFPGCSFIFHRSWVPANLKPETKSRQQIKKNKNNRQKREREKERTRKSKQASKKETEERKEGRKEGKKERRKEEKPVLSG